jgi:hypothetical protein
MMVDKRLSPDLDQPECQRQIAARELARELRHATFGD